MMSGPDPESKDNEGLQKTLKRYTYQPPADTDSPAAKEMEVLTSYMKETHLQDVMSKLLGMLLSLTRLPYNPYPGFVRRLRAMAEKFHVFNTPPIPSSEEKIMETSVAGMYGLQGCDNIWGLKHMVSVMDGKAMKRYDWLIHDVTPKEIVGMEEHPEYTGQILVALVGPAAFTGLLYDNVDSIDIRLEYVIYGPDVEMGVDLFVNSVIDDIDRSAKGTCPHLLLDVSVPLVDSPSGTKSKKSSTPTSGSHHHRSEATSKVASAKTSLMNLFKSKRLNLKTASSTAFSETSSATSFSNSTCQIKKTMLPEVWTTQDMCNRKDEFGNTIRTAVRHRCPITLQCVFAMNKDRKYFKQGSKQYVLHFIETREESDKEIFAELPFITIHEGIFLRKADCETYVTTMMRHDHITSEIKAAQEGQRSELKKQGLLMRSDDAEFEQMIPYLNVVVAPIKNHLEHTLSTLDHVMDAFKVTHLALNLILLERTRWHNDVLVEIQRFLHSTAYKWHIAMSHNTMIQQVIQCQIQQDEPNLHVHQEMLIQVVRQYRGALIHVLDTSLSGEFPSQHPVPSVIRLHLQHLSNLAGNDHSDYQQVLQCLVSLQQYCTTVYLQLLDDALTHLQQVNLQAFVRRSDTIPSEGKTAHGGGASDATKNKSKTTSSSQPSSSTIDVPHGVEDRQITQQKHFFVDTEAAKLDRRWPGIIANDAVMIQYLVDVRLDQVWQELLLNLFSQPWLPPNPYPGLVSHLRQAALRMQLCQETNQQLAQRLLHFQSVKALDKTNTVYHIPGCNAYGCYTALVALDTGARGFPKIAAVMGGVIGRLQITQKGQFQIQHGSGMSDLCPLYGQLIPYLTQLVLHEYIYIKGPMGAHGQAIQLFTRLVCEMVGEMTQQNLVIMGVSFGDSRWLTIQQILDSRDQFMSHLVDAVQAKEDVSIKFYQAIGWRYLCIVKYFRFHYLYIDNAEDRCEPFYDFSSVEFYQTVFLTEKLASFHSAQVKCINGVDIDSTARLKLVNAEIDSQIQFIMKDSNDLMKVYKLLLRRALINKDAESVAELWRIFHSVAYQIDYVNCLNQDLRDLIQLALDYPGLTSLDQYSLEESPVACPLQADTLVQFYQVYKDKLTCVLQDPCAFAPASLMKLVEKKLSEVGDSSSDVQRSLINKKSVDILQDIADLLKPIKDIIAADLMKISPQTQKLLEDIVT